MRTLITVLSILLVGGVDASAASRACQTNLTSPLNWINPGISNHPYRRSGENLGLIAHYKGKIVLARPCAWCPEFDSTASAEEWMASHPLGVKTRMAALSLAYLSRRNVADHFYGLTLNQRRLHFVSKIPKGDSLSTLVESHPTLVTAEPVGHVSVRGWITLKQFEGYQKLRLAVREEGAPPLPIDDVVFAEPNGNTEANLMDFVKSIELSTGDGLKVSYFHLDRVFNSNGELKIPYQYSSKMAPGMPAITIGTLLHHILILFNNRPNEAWNRSLSYQNMFFFFYGDFLEGLKSEKSSDPLIRIMRSRASSIEKYDRPDQLIGLYQAGQVAYRGNIRFVSEHLWNEHFLKHGQEFGVSTREEYLALAGRFLEGENVAQEIGLSSKNRRVDYRRLSAGADEYVVIDPDSRIVAVIGGRGLKTFFIQHQGTSGMDIDQYLVEQARQDIRALEKQVLQPKTLNTRLNQLPFNPRHSQN